jgi:hypothetical protein
MSATAVMRSHLPRGLRDQQRHQGRLTTKHSTANTEITMLMDCTVIRGPVDLPFGIFCHASVVVESTAKAYSMLSWYQGVWTNEQHRLIRQRQA